MKDTSVNGIEGFNINLAAPFKFNDYIVGFKYTLGNIKKFPESLFAKKSFDTFGEGTATVETEYSIGDSTLGLSGKWVSDSLGLTVDMDGDTKDKVKNVGVTKLLDINDNKFKVRAAYDLLKKKISGSTKVTVDSTAVEVCYDNVDKDPVLSVTHALDSENDVMPSISLKSGDITYGWKRKWTGGSLQSSFHPGDKFAFIWKDEGSSGTWTTKAEVPVNDAANTKISFNRDWVY